MHVDMSMWVRPTLRLIVVLLFASSCSSTMAAGAKRPFTVDDSIRMTVAEGLHPSPDGQRTLLLTRRGDLGTGEVEYRLQMYVHADLDIASDSGLEKAPEARFLASFRSSSNREAISQVRWLEDSRTVAFLAENPGEHPQLRLVDVDSGTLTTLTTHPTEVLDYDIVAGSDGFIYSAVAPEDLDQEFQRGLIVGRQSVFTLLDIWRDRSIRGTAYFVASRKGIPSREVEFIDGGQPSRWRPMWLSPSGRKAIAVRFVDRGEPDVAPASWRNYRPLRQDAYNEGIDDPGVDDFTGQNDAHYEQYVVIDMETARGRPLVNAPLGGSSGGAVDVAWLDERSVVVTNAYLPLGANGIMSGSEQLQVPVVAEVDTRNGALSVVERIDRFIDPGDKRAAVRGVRSNHPGRIVLQLAGRGSGGIDQDRLFDKVAGTWQDSDIIAQPPSMPRWDLRLEQSHDVPPNVVAMRNEDGTRIRLTDLNPEWREIEFGTQETIRWTDANGRDWVGGLLLPPRHVPGRRYPLVIQTHGYEENVFLVDGPYGSPGSPSGFAARALASRGIAVLQLDDAMENAGFRVELNDNVAGYAAAVKHLDRLGLVDPDRVGLHGWSRSGFYVQHAITFHGLQLAAASVADGSALGAFTQSLFHGLFYPGMIEYERMIGVPLLGEDNATTWAHRDPSFNMHRVETPLRIESYESPLLWWDMYARMRRYGKPVEMIFLPDGAHTLVKPWERHTSQQGIVDWYDFWLNGYREPSQEKQKQYLRWERMKARMADAAK